MRFRAILFDLDDTLLVEAAANEDARMAACAVAAARYGVEARSLCRRVKAHARALWGASPASSYCRRIGLSSSEGLWCRFLGSDPNVERLRAWAPRYQAEAWRLALADHGVGDHGFARLLAERFADERRRRHVLLPHAVETLTALRQHCKVVLVTNGASCLQREKLAAAALNEHFDAVVVSGDLGVGKPDTKIFRAALAEAGVRPTEAVMVGDSFERDIAGAKRTGLAAMWFGGEADAAGEADAVAADLEEVAEHILDGNTAAPDARSEPASAPRL